MDKEKQIPQTKASFEARGTLFHVDSDNAFKISEKGWRTVNLGLRISDSEVMYITVKGGKRNTVWLSKPAEKKGEKSTTKEVDWADRHKEQRNGFKVIGVSLGLTKKADEPTKNEIVSMTEFDAFDYLKETAEDGMSVFVAGDIEHSSYVKDGETKKITNFLVKRMYLTGEPIDFQAENFEKSAGFFQNGIVMGRREDKEQYFLDLGYVGYGSFETVSVECTKVIFDAIKANGVRPYNSIVFTGVLKTSQAVEEKETDTWGEKSNVGVAKNPARTTLLITGARGETLSKDTYTQKSVEKYLADVEEAAKEREKAKASFETQDAGKKKDAVVTGSWGESSKVDVSEQTSEELPW
jgi:hypothetical protein